MARTESSLVPRGATPYTPVWLGIDVGGANCKFASHTGRVAAWPFPLWKSPQELGPRLQAELERWESTQAESLVGLAVTMTGELADCFWTRREGVLEIVRQVERLSASLPVHYWGTDGRFHSGAEAAEHWLEFAASNWHASSTWVAQGELPDSIQSGWALMLDVGSTTTDIIPHEPGGVVSNGRTDSARLSSGELVYTGLQRSTIASILRSVVVDGRRYRVASETFATAEDAHLVLGHLAEAPERTDTADGRPATVVHAHGRLARMIGEDAETLRGEQTRQIAEQVLARQINLIRRGIDQVCASRPEAPTKVFVTGHGGVLAREALRRSRAAACESVDLEAKLGRNIARAFPAFALARMAARIWAPSPAKELEPIHELLLEDSAHGSSDSIAFTQLRDAS
ncbi:MAG: hypothetical protein KDA83_00580 [Planctomycetales bacterium]|nr:hypothetical protein [Planctomycetales bacterium]